jgi:hypothetical protein
MDADRPGRHGAEASFLVLGGDPMANFANVRQIRVRVKQGVRLQLPDEDPQFPKMP